MNSLNKKIKKASPRYKQRLDTHQLAIGTATLYRIHKTLIKSLKLREYEEALDFLPPSDYELYSDKKAGKNKTWEEMSAHHLVTPASWNLYKLIIRFINNNIGNKEIIERAQGDIRHPPYKIKLTTDALIKTVLGETKASNNKLKSYRALIKNLEQNQLIYYQKEGDVKKDKRGREHTFYYPIVFVLSVDDTLNYIDFLLKIKRQKYKYFKPICHQDVGEDGKRIPNRLNHRIFMQMGHALDPADERVVALREAYFNLFGVYYNLLLSQVNDVFDNKREPFTDREYLNMVNGCAETISELLESVNEIGLNQNVWADYCLYMPLWLEHIQMFLRAVRSQTYRNHYKAQRGGYKQPPIQYVKWMPYKFNDWQNVKSLTDKFKPFEPLINAINTVNYCKYLIDSKVVFATSSDRRSSEHVLGKKYYESLYSQSKFLKKYFLQFDSKTIFDFVKSNPNQFTDMESLLKNWYKRAEKEGKNFSKILYKHLPINTNICAILGSISFENDGFYYEKPKLDYENLAKDLGISYENMGLFAILGSIFAHNFGCRSAHQHNNNALLSASRINSAGISYVMDFIFKRINVYEHFGNHSGERGEDWIGIWLGISCILDNFVE